MSLGGKYVYATVMCMLMALGMFMFVKVMSSLISVMSPLLVCAHCLCVLFLVL